MYLVASLGDLAFKPAVPFAYRQEAGTVPIQQQPPTWIPFIYFIIAIAIVMAVVFFLLPPDLRKKYLWALARLILIGLVTFLILSRLSVGPSLAQPTQGAGNLALTVQPEPTDTPEPAITPVEYVQPQVSPWVSYGVALAFLLIVVGIFWWVMSRRRQTGAPYDALAEIARSALKETRLNLQARRIVRLQRQVLLRRLRGAGIQVVDWDMSQPFEKIAKRELERRPVPLRGEPG